MNLPPNALPGTPGTSLATDSGWEIALIAAMAQ